MTIRPYRDADLDAIIRFSLRAWAPVFASLEQVMDPDVYRALHPDWRASQHKAVKEACTGTGRRVWVAEEEGAPVGFMAVVLRPEEGVGEIYMIAVDPAYQRKGVGIALTEFALDWIKKAGMTVAMVETGGDPGHAPARQTYEKAGFQRLPIARYFKKL